MSRVRGFTSYYMDLECAKCGCEICQFNPDYTEPKSIEQKDREMRNEVINW